MELDGLPSFYYANPMQQISDWLAMDGYGMFVWPAYAVTFGVLGIMAWRTARQLRQARQRLEQLESRE